MMKRLTGNSPGAFARRRLTLIAAGGLAAAGIVAAAGGASTGPAAGNPPVNSSLPTTSGSAQQGQTLSASTGAWTGDAPISYSFAWQRCGSSGGSCTDISAAMAQTYLVASSDVGSTLRVVVTASNTAGTSTAASSPTGVVAPPGDKPAPTSQPTPQGTAQVGNTLTISPGTWSGTTPISFSYQWQRCASNGTCTSISGATNSYTVASADVGYRLRAVVTGSNSIGSASVDSNLTATVVAAGSKPAASSQPTPQGSARAGQTLTINPGSWSGTTPITFTYQWQRCPSSGTCTSIPGATRSSYAVAPGDVGYHLRVSITGTNSAGSTTIISNLTATVLAATTLPTGAIQLPGGKISIPVTSVSLPDRLVISSVSYSPNPVRGRTSFQGDFRVTDSKGYVVRGALVYALGIPYSWVGNTTEVTTGTDGYAYVTINPTAKLPRKGALMVFVRARKPGGSLLAGVSTRRLTQVTLRPS